MPRWEIPAKQPRQFPHSLRNFVYRAKGALRVSPLFRAQLTFLANREKAVTRWIGLIPPLRNSWPAIPRLMKAKHGLRAKYFSFISAKKYHALLFIGYDGGSGVRSIARSIISLNRQSSERTEADHSMSDYSGFRAEYFVGIDTADKGRAHAAFIRKAERRRSAFSKVRRFPRVPSSTCRYRRKTGWEGRGFTGKEGELESFQRQSLHSFAAAGKKEKADGFSLDDTCVLSNSSHQWKPQPPPAHVRTEG